MLRARSSLFSAKFVIFLIVCSSLLPSILATSKYSENPETSREDDNSIESHDGRTIPNKSYGKEDPIDSGEKITSMEDKRVTECPNEESELKPEESGDEETSDESGNKNEMVFEGAYAPVFSPTDEHNALNFSIIPKYVKYLHKSGVKGILVAGTTGEGPTMTIDERKRLLEAYLIEARKFGLKVIAQVAGNSAPDAKELAMHAQEVKADAILALSQIYYKPKSIEQLVQFLELLYKSAPKLPIFYYHSPQRNGVSVNIRAFFRYASAKIPKFMGVKGNSGVALQLADLLRGEQKVFVSGDFIASNTLLGFDTSITTVTNMFMDQVTAIQSAVQSGDFEKARTQQNRLDNIIREIKTIGNETVPLLKATMEIVTGMEMGPARLAQKRISKQQREAIRKILEKYDVDIMSR